MVSQTLTLNEYFPIDIYNMLFFDLDPCSPGTLDDLNNLITSRSLSPLPQLSSLQNIYVFTREEATHSKNMYNHVNWYIKTVKLEVSLSFAWITIVVRDLEKGTPYNQWSCNFFW